MSHRIKNFNDRYEVTKVTKPAIGQSKYVSDKVAAAREFLEKHPVPSDEELRRMIKEGKEEEKKQQKK